MAISRMLSAHGSVFLHTSIESGKVTGLSPNIINALTDSVDLDVILI